MKILVTGSSSFIGFNLVNHLSKKYEVFWSTTKKLKYYKGVRKLRLEKLKKKYNVIINLNKNTDLEKLFKKHKFDYIFIHHAYTKEANNDKLFNLSKAIDTNIRGLDKIYSLSKIYGIKKIIHTGTNQEYGNYKNRIKENYKKKPETLYGLSKTIQANYLKYLSYYFKIPTISLKIFNVFGKLDNPNKVTSIILKNLNNNLPTNLSSCHQVRDFIYIKDLCKMYERIMFYSNKDIFEEFNICSSNNITLKKFLLKICRSVNKNVKLLNFNNVPIRKGENNFNLGSNTKIKTKFKFKFNLNKSIKDYINSEQY